MLRLSNIVTLDVLNTIHQMVIIHIFHKCIEYNEMYRKIEIELVFSVRGFLL